MESSMDAEHEIRKAPSRALALFEVAVASMITIGSVALFLIMPDLIEEGGIQAAQEFVRLSSIFFPRMTFGMLSVLGLCYLAVALRRIPAAQGAQVFREGGALRRVLIMFALALSYPLLIPWIGYGFTSVLVIGAMTVILGNRVWWQVLAFALGAPVCIRFIFERMLKISLPRADFEALDAVEEAVMQLLSGIILSI